MTIQEAIDLFHIIGNYIANWIVLFADIMFIYIIIIVYRPSYGKTNHNEFDDEI